MQRAVEGKTLDVYPGHVQLFLSATDAKVGVSKIYYSINGGTMYQSGGAIKNFKSNIEYTIKTKSVDFLGNEQEQEFKFLTE